LVGRGAEKGGERNVRPRSKKKKKKKEMVGPGIYTLVMNWLSSEGGKPFRQGEKKTGRNSNLLQERLSASQKKNTTKWPAEKRGEGHQAGGVLFADSRKKKKSWRAIA